MLRNISKRVVGWFKNTLKEPEEVPGRPALWSAVTAAGVVAGVYLLAVFIGGMLLSMYAASHHWSQVYIEQWLHTSITAQFFYVLIDGGVTLLLLWAFIRWRRYRGIWKALGLLRPHRKDFRYVISGIVVYFILYFLTTNIAVNLTSIDLNQQQDVGFQIVSSHFDLLLAFISLVVLPPIIEEIVFRGFLFSGLRRQFRFTIAAFLTSALFAVPHLFESNGGGLLWTAGIDTFILSLVLCYAREKNRQIVGQHGNSLPQKILWHFMCCF